MADESAPATRTINIPYLSLVTRADPDWARDHKMQPELEPHGLPASRAAVKHNWAARGPYEAED